MKQRLSWVTLVVFCAVLFTAALLPCTARCRSVVFGSADAVAPAAKPLIVWYSRSGTSQLVAETIQKQLGCDIDKIPSTKDRGFLSIVNEQYFGGEDEQAKYGKSLAGYNPIYICAPVYFMKVSAPARAFMELNRDSLQGKDIYLFVTMGGRLSDPKMQGIKEYGSGLGLNIKAVTCMPTGKKEEFPGRIKEFLGNYPQAKSAH